MIRGGVAILDEGNRMSEKSWASLAPLLDNRRYVESIVAGVKIKAHPDFRLVATMNDDSSTFDLPEYIHSRLQPQILIDFPEREEELAIFRENLPFSPEDVLQYVTDFLQQAHAADESYTVRDGVNIARYALKLSSETGQPAAPPAGALRALGARRRSYALSTLLTVNGSMEEPHTFSPAATSPIFRWCPAVGVLLARAPLFAPAQPEVVAVELPSSLERHTLRRSTACRRCPSS